MPQAGNEAIKAWTESPDKRIAVSQYTCGTGKSEKSAVAEI